MPADHDLGGRLAVLRGDLGEDRTTNQLTLAERVQDSVSIPSRSWTARKARCWKRGCTSICPAWFSMQSNGASSVITVLRARAASDIDPRFFTCRHNLPFILQRSKEAAMDYIETLTGRRPCRRAGGPHVWECGSYQT